MEKVVAGGFDAVSPGRPVEPKDEGSGGRASLSQLQLNLGFPSVEPFEASAQNRFVISS